MAKQHLVKCKYCGETFDTNKEEWTLVGKNRYAHKKCSDIQSSLMTQDEKDYLELEKYIKKLFNINVISAKIQKQIKTYKEQYNYTFSGMKKTLYWWFELKRNSITQANDGIGIIPYAYKDCSEYYYRLYLAEIANNLNNTPTAEIPTVEIVISSPRPYNKKKIKLFDLEEENNE